MNKSIEHTTSPLPFITPAPEPEHLFSQRLQRSSYLFPKPISSPRMLNNNDCSNRAHFERAPKEAANNEEKNRSLSNASELRRRTKKSVRFHAKIVTVHRLDDPAASDMTPREKQMIWYNSNMYDQFKYEASRCAGVKIIQHDQNRRFVMVGDFDSQDGKGGVSSSSSSHAAGKFYHNENEYNDHVIKGELVCKRGLGYHFSRNRKKSRVVTRSAVVAWQKTLRDPSNPMLHQDLPKVGSDLLKLGKSQIMLALVSTKCSRIAREEARWRGDVDYRVAHPGRQHDSLAVHPKNHCKSTTANNDIVGKLAFNTENESMAAKKRPMGSDMDVSMNSCHKRQRSNAIGCGGDNRDELSPETIRYLSTV